MFQQGQTVGAKVHETKWRTENLFEAVNDESGLEVHLPAGQPEASSRSYDTMTHHASYLCQNGPKFRPESEARTRNDCLKTLPVPTV